MKNGKPTARKNIVGFELDKWFLTEELYRPKNDGFVFFIHTKFLLIDPLSDDPLVCSGSANFSPPSLMRAQTTVRFRTFIARRSWVPSRWRSRNARRVAL